MLRGVSDLVWMNRYQRSLPRHRSRDLEAITVISFRVSLVGMGEVRSASVKRRECSPGKI